MTLIIEQYGCIRVDVARKSHSIQNPATETVAETIQDGRLVFSGNIAKDAALSRTCMADYRVAILLWAVNCLVLMLP
ncbi:unnamed protein product [Caenorhabditis auriculariae]|uniref:Uncharacterized protein n=1 Tax=Caenorhabditis auriculariae TaxID=2777116 RepID=A0A8S1H1Z5_9PELO|nr:unnamed protein product [Caenorhabditis auriculariae]